MSTIALPDPFPGRCHNLRASRFHPGSFLRCLDYEGSRHVCEFPIETPPVVGAMSYSTSTTQLKPWIDPRTTP